MTRADAPAFSTLLAGLAEVFDVPLTATRTELYYRALEDLPLPALQRAAGLALREARFFPKPAELRALAGESATESAELAWMALLENFQRCNGYDFTEPDDPITRALILVFWGRISGAWEWWRGCHDLALERRHAEFVARYQEYGRRPPHELPRLPGGRIFRQLEEARHALAAGAGDDDRGRPAALPLPDVRVDVGKRTAARAHGVPRAPQAQGAPESPPAARQAPSR